MFQLSGFYCTPTPLNPRAPSVHILLFRIAEELDELIAGMLHLMGVLVL